MTDAVAAATESLSSLTINDNNISLPSAVSNVLTSSTSPATAIPANSQGIIGWMLYLIGSVILGVTRIFVWALSFATITIPTLIFKILSVSFTLTLNFSSLYPYPLFDDGCVDGRFALSFVTLAVAYWILRYRYLTEYSRLPPEPQRKEPQIDLFPDSQEGDSKPGLQNYLDEFLSAIKIFGYLERPVFHELARHMQTRQLIAGDTLLLEEEKSFCLVVDGLVQVFVKSPPRLSQTDDDDEEWEGGQGYQLLTEAKNGAPLSSLFSILALFTEDINLPSPPQTMDSSMHEHLGSELVPYEPPPVFNLNDPGTPPNRDVHGRHQTSMHPDIVARASVDSTIAVIPAEAFKRLVRIYPKASAHIVQVILTRFQRVTFLTGHKYLGLTAEILKTEKLLNTKGTYELPNILRRGVLEKLKERYLQTDDGDEADTGVFIHTHARSTGRRRSNVGHRPSRLNSTSGHTGGFVQNVVRRAAERAGGESPRPRRDAAPGDILSSVPLHMGNGTSPSAEIADSLQRPSLSQTRKDSFQGIESDESDFRDAVLDCMFKAIGLSAVDSALKPAVNGGSSSAPASPRLVSYDSVRQKAVFTHATNLSSLPAFGQHSFPLLGNGSQSSAMDDEEQSVSSSLLSIQSELENDVEIVFFKAGTVLVEQEERTPGLYYVIDGFLETCLVLEDEKEDDVIETRAGGIKQDVRAQPEETTQKLQSLFLVKPGGLAGYLGSISGFPSFCEIRAKTDVLVGFLPRSSLERIMEKQPVVLLTMAKRLISLLSPLVLHIDFALEWIQVNAGQVIYHQNDPSDNIYIVLNGRVRTLTSTHEVVGEYGRGESVGELEVLTDQKRGSTLHAIRDTELARFPKTLFNTLALEHPRISMQIYKMIANRLKTPKTLTAARHTFNLRTVGIIPVRQGIPIMEFAKNLQRGIAAGVGVGCQLLNQERVLETLGRHAFNRMGKLKLAGYLGELEEKWDMVLYVADTGVNSPWTQTCISQADCILLVGLANDDPSIGEYERFLVGSKTTARKELVLVHPDQSVKPGTTREWLKNRIWVHQHHHVQMTFRTTPTRVAVDNPPRATRTLTFVKNKLQTIQSDISKYTSRRIGPSSLSYAASMDSDDPTQHRRSDFSRLARHLCGKAIGLVLGGGGARGISQVGVIRALEEAGIPIDIVGGTSIGAFNAGLYAKDADSVPIYGRAKKFAGRMASLWRLATDLTWPTTSYTTGHEFNRGIWKTFGDSHIEDFWLPFYCNSANILKFRMEIHTTGYAWRYIRASMTLTGFLPPMTDEEGNMLVDGGYMDNLTVAAMKDMGADVIFAIDVGSVNDSTPQRYGDSLSGIWGLFNHYNPFSKIPDVPTLSDIQSRLAYATSVPALEKAKASPGVLYMQPPVQQYGTLDFGKFDEIYEVGYQYCKQFLNGLKKEGKLEGIVSGSLRSNGRRGPRLGRRQSI